MVEIIDGQEQIVMSLGGLKAASRGALLGLERAQVYQLRTDARKSNDAVKKGIASPLSDRPAPAVTAGSSPESRTDKSKPPTTIKVGSATHEMPSGEKAEWAKDDHWQNQLAGQRAYRVKVSGSEDYLRDNKPGSNEQPVMRFKTTEQAQTYADKVNRAVDRAKKPTATAKTPAVSSKPSPEKRLSSDPVPSAKPKPSKSTETKPTPTATPKQTKAKADPTPTATPKQSKAKADPTPTATPVKAKSISRGRIESGIKSREQATPQAKAEKERKAKVRASMKKAKAEEAVARQELAAITRSFTR